MRLPILALAAAATLIGAPASALTLLIKRGPGTVGKAVFQDFSFLRQSAEYFNDVDYAAGLPINNLELEFTDAAGNTFSFDETNTRLLFLAIEGYEVLDFVIGAAPSGFDIVSSSEPAADFLLAGGELSSSVGGAFITGFPVSVEVPAPAALALFGLGLGVVALRRR